MTAKRVLLSLAGLAVVAAAAVAWGRPAQHVAYGPLRDCLALRGGLVTPIDGGTAQEGSARVLVGNDTAVLAVAHDAAEAKALLPGYLDATRYDNLLVAAGSPWPSGTYGTLALKAVERCLSDAHGRATTDTLGYSYPLSTVATVESACRKVHASLAQCRCVLTGSQAQLSPADFQLAADGASPEAQLAIEEVLDGCRLVG